MFFYISNQKQKIFPKQFNLPNGLILNTDDGWKSYNISNKKIIDQLPDELKDSSNYDMGHSLYNFPKGYILDIHKDGTTSPPDKKRQSFIHVPISDQASPINFYTEDQELIHSHTYSCATLVNTQTWHNVGIPHVDRISLQINLPMRYTFGQVSEMIEKHFDFM